MRKAISSALQGSQVESPPRPVSGAEDGCWRGPHSLCGDGDIGQ